MGCTLHQNVPSYKNHTHMAVAHGAQQQNWIQPSTSHLTMVQNRFGIPFWLVGAGAPPILGFLLVVGLGCSLGANRDFYPWPNFCAENGPPASRTEQRPSGNLVPDPPAREVNQGHRNSLRVAARRSSFAKINFNDLFLQPHTEVS